MRSSSGTEENFYLPNFCSSKAVLLLVIAAEMLALVLVLANSARNSFDWSFLGSLSLFIQWIVLLSAGSICILKPLLNRFSTAIITSACLAIFLTMTSLFTALTGQVPDAFSIIKPDSVPFSWQGLSGPLLRNNLIALILGTVALRYFFLQKELIRQKRSELTARIQSLQSRIQPHFLFNSMNTIAGLIPSRPKLAEQVVEDLSELFRASLEDAAVLISLEEEIALAQQYLRIEALRFGDRLSINWNIDQPLPDFQIPRLCLQPLLENAIIHGIQPCTSDGVINISVTHSSSELLLTVQNTIPAEGQQAENGNQIALINIADRLSAIFKEQARLHSGVTEQEGRHWYETRLIIPLNP